MIAIIDYKAGNAPSVFHAIKHLALDAKLASSADDIKNASHIILPGVGSAKATMDSLREMNLIEALETAVLSKKTPFLGICVGMQVIFEHSEEEDAQCFGWLKGCVIKYDKTSVRVPQMGWNQVTFKSGTPMDAKDDYFYFVNSFYATPADKNCTWGTADYGGIFTAAVCQENIFGTQFHVEKSGEAGLSLLNSFLCLTGGLA